MPDLIDLSSRQAISLLETYGLRIGELIYVPDIARNAVLQQKYNKGSIEPGTLIEKGTAIDLVLGSGVASTQVNVPLLIGKTREEATRLILSASLNIGNEVFLDAEDAQARVYRQSPNVLEGPQQVQMGTAVDLYYRSGAAFDFEAYLREVTYLETPVLFGKTPQEARRLIENMGLVIGTETFENRVRPENARVHRQDPDILDKPAIPRGTRINIWYRSLADLDAD
jgi:beta-lactam-binding protein with PASTA domain